MRHTKLNKKIQDEICKYIRAGCYVETAAAMAGISKQSYYNWFKRGAREQERREQGKEADKKETVYVNFLDAVNKAMAEAELFDLTVINKAAQAGQWQASAWKLERRNPKVWARQTKLDEKRIAEAESRTELNKARLELITGGGEKDTSLLLAIADAVKGE